MIKREFIKPGFLVFWRIVFSGGRGPSPGGGLLTGSFCGTEIKMRDGVACKMELVNKDAYRGEFFVKPGNGEYDLKSVYGYLLVPIDMYSL